MYPASQITNFGVPYDYASVMHYSAYAFSRNGGKTIEPKVSQLLYLFGVNLWVLRQHSSFFLKAIRLIKIQNNKQRQEVKQQPLSADTWVNSQVSLSSNYGDWVAVGQICLSTSVICCQYQSTNAQHSFTYLSPTTNNLRNWQRHQMTQLNKMNLVVWF